MLAQKMEEFAGDGDEPLRESVRPLAMPRHKGAQLLLKIWREREAAGGFVIGRDIPSRATARILQNMIVYEPVERDGAIADFRTRIAGDTLRFRFGINPAGKLLSQLFSPKEFAKHLAMTREAIRESVPVLLNSEMSRGLVIERRLEIVVLPVWNAERTARWILAGVFYFD